MSYYASLLYIKVKVKHETLIPVSRRTGMFLLMSPWLHNLEFY